MRIRRFAAACLLAPTLGPASAAALAAAGPGAARCSAGDGSAELRNASLRLALSSRDGVLAPAAFDNGFTQVPHALQGELFSVTTRAKLRLGSKDFHLDATPVCETIAGHADAARAAERRAGVALHATLTHPGTGLRVTWRAVLRDGTSSRSWSGSCRPPL